MKIGLRLLVYIVKNPRIYLSRVLIVFLFVYSNQVGFLPNEKKSAIVFTNDLINNDSLIISKVNTDEIVFKNSIGSLVSKYGSFSNCYKLDFSSLSVKGVFYIKIEDEKSFKFSIGNNLYNSVIDSLLTFFKIQRCGFNPPLLHDFCHYYDATNLILNGKELKEKKDITEVWHDAGDYIKFLNTTAYRAYTLLFSYDFDSNKFNFDLKQ